MHVYTDSSRTKLKFVKFSSLSYLGVTISDLIGTTGCSNTKFEAGVGRISRILKVHFVVISTVTII